MKNLLLFAATLCLLISSAGAQTLNVHEWGTFTTLHGSAGGTLSGLYYEEEQLLILQQILFFRELGFGGQLRIRIIKHVKDF